MICSTVPTLDTHLTNKLYIANNYLPLAGGTLTGNLNGITPAQLGYLGTITSNVQTQINTINNTHTNGGNFNNELYVNNGSTATTTGSLRLVSTAIGNFIQSGQQHYDIASTSTSADLIFCNMSWGTEWMRIKSDGKIGIGTNAPAEKLEVIGNITQTGLTANTVLYADSNKKITSSAVSNTTLAYLDATSSIQTQLTSLLNRIAALESLFFISSATMYYENQYDVISASVTFGYFEYNLINMTTGKATVAVFNNVQGSPIQWFNILTDPDLNVYYRAGQIEAVNNAAYNILVNFSIRKLL